MKVTFQKESEFTKELKSEVKLYLTKDAHGKFADAFVWTKATFLISVCTALYLSILFAPVDFITRTLLVAFFAFSTLILGLNVMHEAAHGNYSSKPWINRLLALTFDIFGISSDLYLIKHTQFHHNYTNMYEYDGDINEAPLIRMSEKQPWFPIHRYQAFYTPLLYSLITITWPLFDIGRLISPKVGTQSFRRPNALTTAKILVFKGVSFYLTYVLPIQTLGVKTAVFFIFLFHLGLGGILALIFQVAHVHEDGKFNESTLESDWFVHQIRTSADFSTQNPIVNWLCGGLNYQVIHHLFPNVSYRHYPAIRLILKRLCVKHSLRYIEFPSFRNAVKSHFEWLQQLASGET